MKQILALLLVSLPSWGLAQSNPAVATVNKETISQPDLLQRLVANFGTQTLNQMIDEKLIQQEIKRLGIKPNAKEVEERLSRIRQQFKDAATFEQQLKTAGTSLEIVKNQISLEVTRDTLIKKLAKIEVNESELKDFFEQNKDKLGSPESVHLRHILVKTEQEANDLLIAVRAGADFGKLAQQKSLDEASRPRGGDMGFVTKGMLQPNIEKVVFDLKPGETTSPMPSAVGFHLLQMVEKRPNQPAQLSKIKGDIRQALLTNKISQALPNVLQQLRAKAKIEYATAPSPTPTPTR
ncbi:MAG: peptidylprolyl isomerase [Elusimicrobia bacterium]|nr:peptidylprolyl isomerase [Elusimicrobiota bacterium]